MKLICSLNFPLIFSKNENMSNKKMMSHTAELEVIL